MIGISRLRRIDAPLGEYHVVVKGNLGQVIFEDDDDRIAFLEAVVHYRKKYGFKLHAYALMDNHVHMLINADGKMMASAMQAIQLKYVKHYRDKYELDGHLFKGRYYSVPVYDSYAKLAEITTLLKQAWGQLINIDGVVITSIFQEKGYVTSKIFCLFLMG